MVVGVRLPGGVCRDRAPHRQGRLRRQLPSELSAALSLSTGMLLAGYGRRPGPRAALLVVLALQLVIMVQTSQAFYTGLQSDVISDRDGLARLESVVEGTDRPVLADEYSGLVPLDGQRIQLQPFEFSQLSREGKWDQRPLVEAIREEEFGAILIFKPPGASWLVRDRWTPQMLQAVEDGYEPAGKYAGTVVYRPKQHP